MRSDGRGRDGGGRREAYGPPQRHNQQPEAAELIYGRWPVLEALRAGSVARLYIVGEMRSEARAEVEEEARARGVPLQLVGRAEMEDALPGSNHQGFAAECAPYRYLALNDIVAALADRGPEADSGEEKPAPRLHPLLLALDSVQDPQNLGALLRTAEATGVGGVLLPRHRSAEVTPAVVRSSAGAAAHLRIAQVTNLTRALKELQSAGYWSVGLDMAAPLSYDRVDSDRPLVLVVGSEGQGLGRLVSQSCDYLVSLPMLGRVASLNAATSGAIVLYDIRRRQLATAAQGD